MKTHANARLTVRARELLCRRVSEDGWTLRAAAAALGVSEPTARKWLRRYQREGVRGLADRSSAPRRVANRTAAEWVWLIEQLRRWRLTGVEIAVGGM